MPDLSEEQAGQLMVLLLQSVDDKAKAARVSEILEAQAKASAATAILRKQEAANRDLLQEVNAKLSEAATMAANAEARSRELDKREAEIGEVSRVLTAEKARWEEMRQQVDKDHAERDRALTAAANAVSARLDQLNKDSARIAAKEVAAELLKSQYEAKHQRLTDALAANS